MKTVLSLLRSDPLPLLSFHLTKDKTVDLLGRITRGLLVRELLARAMRVMVLSQL